jgi:hypothetical protein
MKKQSHQLAVIGLMGIARILSGCGGRSAAENTSAAAGALQVRDCSPSNVPGRSIGPGVTYYDCSDVSISPRVHIVTIDRTLPAMELRLLTDPASDARKQDRGQPLDEFWLNLRPVDTFAKAAGAVISINGFQWEGDSGKILPFVEPANPIGIPNSTIYIDNVPQNTHVQDKEVLMGFAQGGPEGIHGKRIPKVNQFDQENLAFQYQMYGSGTNVMKDGLCEADGDLTSLPFLHQNDRWSIVGYSDTHIVFLSATGHPYLQQDLCATLELGFGVTNAVRQDGGHSPTLYVGGPVNKIVNRLGSDCALDPLVIGRDPSTDPIECTVPVFWAAEFGSAPRVAYALGLVPRATVTSCSQIMDRSSVVIGMLCITPDNTGYDVQFIPLDNGPSRCGTFDFNLVSKDGQRVGDQGPFDACTGDGQNHSYYFRTGTMGGCAKVQLLRVAGDEFGVTQWEQPSCGVGRLEPADGGTADAGIGPAPVDTTAPTTTVTVPPANVHGWHNTDVTVTFHATDSGAVVSGVRAIHISLSGAQTGTTVLPGAGGSVTVSAEGTTHVTYFAIDNAGNVEASKSFALNIDKTPPLIAGMPVDCALWPPNHKMVAVATVSASDSLSGMAAFDVTASSNEPAAPKEPDIVMTGSDLDPRSIELRAERSGRGGGRVYSITASATDLADNTAKLDAACTVAHDQGHKK